MPELPEAEMTRRSLEPLCGAICTGFFSDYPKALQVTKSAHEIAMDVAGRTVLALRRIGKAILLDLGPGITGKSAMLLACHQRMSGRLLLRQPHGQTEVSFHQYQKISVAGTQYLHHRLDFEDGRSLEFHDPRKFGLVWYGTPQQVMIASYFAALGPDALGLEPEMFSRRLRSAKGCAKAALLDQTRIAGVGNIIADECLFEAGIAPDLPLAELGSDRLAKLHAALQDVLQRSLQAQGSTLRDWRMSDDQPGSFQEQHRVYGRAGLPCLHCGALLIKSKVAGRGTVHCAHCQR